MSLPKVLIVGQPFNNDTGGGITLSNLFAGWDRDRLAVISSGYLLSKNIDTEICNTYYQLGHEEQKWIFPLKYLKRKYESGLIKFDNQRIQDLTIHKSKLRVRIIKDFMYPFLNYIGISHCVSKINLSRDLCNWLDNFKPDILYVQVNFREEILFCLQLQSYLKKPLVLHMMDDWPSTIGKKGLFKNFWYKKIDKELRSLLDRATVLLSISDHMANEYKNRYGKEFITFHNPINIDFWQKYQRSSYELNDSPTILYAGRIGLGIDTSLELIARAIEDVNKELNMEIKFVLQTQEKPLWIKNYKKVTHTGFVSYHDLPKVFSQSDFLLLPYDFSPQSLQFIQFSMPTKGPEYMMSGTPIILFAPEETAIVKYCQTYKCAKIITENSINEITKAIKDLIQNETERKEIANKAKKIAAENHNSADVTNDFKNIICSVTAPAFS